MREFFDRCLGKPHVQVELEANTPSVGEMDEHQRHMARTLARLVMSVPADLAETDLDNLEVVRRTPPALEAPSPPKGPGAAGE